MISEIRLTALLLLMFALFLSCTPLLPRGDVRGPGTFKVKTDIVHGSFRRYYNVHIPRGHDGNRTLPLVVVVHGAFDTAKGMERFSGFSDLADQENFIVLYPEGIGIMGFLQHWNAGHCCGKAANDGIDDVGFVAAAINEVCQRFPVDDRRVFMVGFSNGGMFTYRFAAERGEMLAGAAALAASIGSQTDGREPEWRMPEPVNPVEFVVMHGLDDVDIPFSGGLSQRWGTPRTYLSGEVSARLWVDRNGCEPAAAEHSALFDGQVRLESWTNCKSGKSVFVYTIEGWEHVWPGRYFTAALDDKNPLRNFDAAEIIWNHFKSQPHP